MCHLKSIEQSPENYDDVGKSPFSVGNTSSNGGFSIAMLVFGGSVNIMEEMLS